MMEQVNKDATPELLNDLKNAIRFGDNSNVSKFPELSKCFLDPRFNPLALPFSYMMNGIEPDSTNNEETDIEKEIVEEENTSNNITSNPENNTPFTPSTSSAIQEEKTPPKENETSDSDDDKSDQIKPPKNKKPKVYRRSKRKVERVYKNLNKTINNK